MARKRSDRPYPGDRLSALLLGDYLNERAGRWRKRDSDAAWKTYIANMREILQAPNPLAAFLTPLDPIKVIQAPLPYMNLDGTLERK